MSEDTDLHVGAQRVTASPHVFCEVLDYIIAIAGILSREGILLKANEPALRAAGLERSAVVGRPFWDCYWWNFDPVAQEELRCAIARAARGEAIRYDAEIRGGGDARVVIDFQLVPHRNAQGEIDFLVASGADITDRKRSETSLQAAHDTFARLVSKSPFGMYVVDADFRLVLVSAGAKKVFSNVSPLIGRDFAEALRIVWPEPFASEVIARFRHCLATGEAHHVPRAVERRQDIAETESYDWRIERVRLSDGRDGVVCHFYDLSQREAFEKALRQSERLFRSLFENAAVGVAQVSPEGKWQRVNQKLCSIVGYSSEGLIGASIYDFIHPDDHEMDRALLQRFADGEIDETQVKKRYLRKDGTAVWVRVAISCVRDRDGAIEYFVRVIEDISAEVAAEARQKLLISELRHRVKNSLAIIQAMASQTMNSAADMESFRTAFSGRLRAMAIAHDSIFAHDGVSADLATVIRNQLDPFAASGRDRLRLSGPRTTLEPESVHGLGLVIHELATNASKYGALSTGEGVIEVAWDVFGRERQRSVELSWTEVGGPPVTPPEKTGFGSRLIEAAVQPLNGRAKLTYRPSGLYAEIAFRADGGSD